MSRKNSEKEYLENEASLNSLNDEATKRTLTKLGIRLDRSEHPMMTLDEAAIYLGMKESTLLGLTARGKIPFYKPTGKMLYFERNELNEWLRRKQSPAK